MGFKFFWPKSKNDFSKKVALGQIKWALDGQNWEKIDFWVDFGTKTGFTHIVAFKIH